MRNVGKGKRVKSDVGYSLARQVKVMLRNRRLLFIFACMAAPFLFIGLWLAFNLTVGLSLLIFGIALLGFSAEKAVEHSVKIASALGVPPLMIGLIVVSLGTDFPEITNSIISSALSHGDINVGDSFGSILAQMTLILGLLALFGGTFKVRREEITIMGACEVLALIAAVSMMEKGYITWMNAFFLVASWPIFMLITRNVMKKPSLAIPAKSRISEHFALALAGFVGVAGGSFVVIESVIALSSVLRIPEYFISFFIVAIGTSLPELVVDLTAIRRRQYEIAIGDAIGSSIVDAGFSIGIGPLFFGRITVSGGLAETTGLYALLCSIIVILTLALREKLDKKAGILFIILYLFAYTTLYVH
ncbi:MAG: sodium:calcium antiporter [Candidatus Bathyarchaeia archaeon]